MTKQEFLDILQEELDITSVSLTPETLISDIDEWDSISAMTTLSVIDEHFGLDFSISEMNELTSVSDILRIIGENKFTIEAD